MTFTRGETIALDLCVNLICGTPFTTAIMAPIQSRLRRLSTAISGQLRVRGDGKTDRQCGQNEEPSRSKSKIKQLNILRQAEPQIYFGTKLFRDESGCGSNKRVQANTIASGWMQN